MRLSTREQSQEIDRLAQSEFGLSSESLMESAGSAVAEEIHSAFKNKKVRIFLLIGPGNNGADGFVAARILRRKGFSNLACAVVREKSASSKIWNLQLQKAGNSGVEVLRLSPDRLKLEIANAEVVVEAIYGSGSKGNLDAELSELVRHINEKDKFVVAVDGPLGLDFDTGHERPVALRSQLSVTFGLAKTGFFIGRGPRCVGKLKVHSIGFPNTLLRKVANTHFAWGEQASAKALPRRDEQSHKGDHGTVVVIAGSNEYPGAGLLAANAAGRAGAGYTYLFSEENVYRFVQMIPEVILRERKVLDLKSIERSSALLVGPGLGVNEQTENLIRVLIKKKFERVILDADALTVIAEKKIWPLPSSWILTPHAGELSRILQKPVKAINSDRYVAAHEASKLLGCVVLLKGFRTIIADGTSEVVILAGNSALAKAGSGDVLAGFIAAFRGQGLSASHAAALGAYVHGRLAKDWLNSGKDILSLLPSDLTTAVPELLKKIRDL